MNRIKLLREEKNIYQKDLAKLLNVSVPAINYYENEKRAIDTKTASTLADYFNVSIDYLLGKSDIRNYDDFKKKNIERLILQLKNMDITEEQINKLKVYLSQEPNKITYEYEEFLNSLNPKVKHFIINDNYYSSLEMFHWAIQRKTIPENTTQYYMVPVYGQISAGQPNWAEENIEGRLPIDTNLMNILNPEEYFFLRVNGESMNKVIKNGAFALIHKQDIVDDGEIAVVLVNGYDATLKKFTRQGDFIILEPESDDSSIKSQVYDKTTNIKILGKYVGKMEFNK